MKKLLNGQLFVPYGGQTISSVAGMSLAINNLSKDIRDYIDWKKTDVTAVPIDHWLVNYLLLSTGKLGYRTDLQPKESFARTDFAVEELARVFGFTTEYNAGRLHIGDNGAVTIYVVGKSPRRKQIDASTPFWNMAAMRYISHGSTSMAMGNNAEPEEFVGSGFDVVEIDLGILHYQAVAFMNYWYKRNPDSPRSLQQLVAMHVLPMLKLSQYDIAIMNRMTAIAQGTPINLESPRLSKSFPDRHREMDLALKSHVPYLLGRDLSFEDAIAALAFPLKNNPWVTLSMDDYSFSRQINWAVLVARYSLLTYLFAICRIDPSRSKRYPVNDIVRSIKRIENDNGLSQVLGLTMRRDFKEKIVALLDQI